MNRKTLPLPTGGETAELRAAFVAPRNSTEEMLAGIWSEKNRINQVGIRDNFFDLGGRLRLAVRLFAEIEKAFNERPPLSACSRTAR